MISILCLIKTTFLISVSLIVNERFWAFWKSGYSLFQNEITIIRILIVPIRLNGLRNVSRIFMNGRQVRMSIGKSRVDLNSSGIALQSPRDVLHLLQRVAHIGVRIGEARLDADGLFVVHESLVEFALLLQNGGEVAVSRCEFGEHLQGLQVEPGRLLDVALLPFDVGLR